MSNFSSLIEIADSIRFASKENENTALKIGSLFLNIIKELELAVENSDLYSSLIEHFHNIEWGNTDNVNDFLTTGVYNIAGIHSRGNDNLPISVGDNATFNATLTVLDSTINVLGGIDGGACITQILSISDRDKGEGDVYIRTGRGSVKIADNITWDSWSVMQTTNDVGIVKDEQHNDGSGWVDGKGMNSLGKTGFYRGVYFDANESFFLLVIDSKPAIATGMGSFNWVTQIKYGLSINNGAVSLRVRRGAPKFDDLDVPIEGEFDWGEWKDFGGGSVTIEAQAPLAQKDGKLSLNIGDGLKMEDEKLVLDDFVREGAVAEYDEENKRLEFKGLSDTSTAVNSAKSLALREFFVAAGAEYNDSGVDIVKTTPWAAYVDDIDFKAQSNIDVLNYTTADLLSIVQDGTTYNYVIDNGVYKVVGRASRGQIVHDERYCVHRAGHYYLNGLGDITEEQMMLIYNHGSTLAIKYFLNTYKCRTNRMLTSISSTTELDGYYYARDCESEVVTLDKGEYSLVNIRTSDNVFGNMFKLAHLLGRYRFESAATNAFYNCKQLKSVKIHQLKYNLSLSDCPLISKKSILYAINNSTATTAITITLHSNAYTRLANDTDIVAALESKSLVTLVSA